MTRKKGGNPGVYKFNSARRELYIAKLRQGMKRGAAAQAVGVTRIQVLNHRHANPEFNEQCELAELQANQSQVEVAETALDRKIAEGYFPAIRYYLENRAPERWSDQRKATVVNFQQHETPENIREKLEKLLEERTNSLPSDDDM